MNLSARIIAQFALAVAITTLLNAANEPAPAVIYLVEGKPLDKIFITSETIEGVDYLLGSPDLGTAAKGSTKRDKIKRIEYRDSQDIDYLKGKGDLDQGLFDKAAGDFKAATTSAKWAWVREQCFLSAADAYLKAKKYDDAIVVLGELENKFPRSVFLAKAISQRGQAELSKGNGAGADAAFAQLDKLTDWGIEAKALAAQGKASVLRAAKKTAEAAAALSALVPSLPVDSEYYAPVLFQIAEDQLAATKAPEALTTYGKLFYAPIGAVDQGRAHLAAARILAERSEFNELVAAFDHAVMAAIIRGDGKVQGQAITLARGLVTKFEKDPKYDKDQNYTKEVKDYRGYLTRF